MATLLTSASTSSALVPASASRDCVCSLRGEIEGLGFCRIPRWDSKVHSVPLVISSQQQQPENEDRQSKGVAQVARPLLSAAAAAALSLSIALSGADLALARAEGVNRPELLPKDFTTVIDVAGFLSPQQEGRIAKDLASIEEETGFKLRVLAQNYPETPGLAIKSYWQVDDNTIVFVADPSLGNILNFNVGSLVDLNVPRSFWSRLAGKYGNIFYWRDKGEDASIEAAVAAIGQCLREPGGPYACSDIK